MDENTPAESNVAADELRAFIERIEHLEDEKKEIGGDIKEVYGEAKGRGYDTKVIRRIVAMRKQDVNERQEFEAILDLYCSALGMWVQDRLPLDDESLRVKKPTRAARAVEGETTIQISGSDGKPLHPPVDLQTFKAATDAVIKSRKRKSKGTDEALRDKRAEGPVYA